MQPGKTTTPAGSAFALARNKLAPPSVLSAKPASAGAAGGVALAVDGKRTVAALAAVAGRGGLSDGDLDEPKEFSGDKIKNMAEATSSLLRSLCAPKESSFPEQDSFSKEVEALQKACDGLVVEGAVSDEDGAITMLLGVQARINLLLSTDNKQSPNDLLLSTMALTKASMEDYMSAQDNNKPMPEGRMSFYDMVKNSTSVQPTPTVCSNDEVKAVLQKTLALLESSDPANSAPTMAGLFYKVRSNCRALAEDVEKHGVDDKTGSAISLIHISALFVLGQHKKYFSYEDAADDSLLSSLRRLEVALRDYKLGGASSAEDTD